MSTLGIAIAIALYSAYYTGVQQKMHRAQLSSSNTPGDMCKVKTEQKVDDDHFFVHCGGFL